MKKKAAHWSDFLAPKYWAIWLLILLMRLLALLPFKAGLVVGNSLGSLFYRIAVTRRKITEVNIKLCFPELSEEEREEFVKNVLKANAIGFIETCWSYWGDAGSIRKMTTIKNPELLDEALAEGKGLVLLGAHYSALDLGGLLFSFNNKPLSTIYRRHKNPLMDYIMVKGRSIYGTSIDRSQFRETVRALRNNRVVWYAPDQDFGTKGSAFVPFFGQTAATTMATTKMVGFNDSPILMFSFRRNADNSGYTTEVSRVEGFPSGDKERDAAIVNETIEREVRKAPEQYMWVHRRFKTQPGSRNKLYKEAGC